MSDRADILFYPPLASIIAPVLAVALEWLFPLTLLPAWFNLPCFIAGLAVSGAAGWLATAGVRAFKAAGTHVDPHEPALVVVTDGPYRFTRNPMYLGMVLLQFGLGLTFSLDWALLIAPILWVLLHFGVVLREETYLCDKFGPEYQALLSKTRRWL